METLSKKTILITSKKWSLDAYDWLRGLIIAALTPVGVILQNIADQFLQSLSDTSVDPTFPELNFKRLAMIGIAAGGVYILRKLISPAKQVTQLEDIPVTEAKAILKEEIKKEKDAQ